MLFFKESLHDTYIHTYIYIHINIYILIWSSTLKRKELPFPHCKIPKIQGLDCLDL